MIFGTMKDYENLSDFMFHEVRQVADLVSTQQVDSADKSITGICKCCGEELYIETVDGESFITCR